MGTPKPQKRGGARRDRTADLLHAMQALSQLSYSPTRGRERYGSKASLSRQNHCAQTAERPLTSEELEGLIDGG